MILTKTLTKKILEQIIKECFLKFGTSQCSLLIDSLKFLGFYYATKSGLSIGIEDLKTPEVKKKILDENGFYLQKISQSWYQGKVSDTERFQSIIDHWNLATELLKRKIIHFYKTFDPANSLYIMSFSGARGNMSQVRQLIGMRGLMADQEGNIIDLPIKNNFREGLTSLDYLISAYGARKGVVDTALKTADSGYLTRRLIYVAQDLIIREIDCKTANGILITLNRNFSSKNLIGRYLLSAFQNQDEFKGLINKPIDEESVKHLQATKTNIQLKIRSCLTCTSSFSICQSCYGWDLSKRNLVSLGEAVGIIAAQSIGEPGTQLTMRTFHTGGIFTSELLQQNLAPFSGRLIFPEHLSFKKYRTSHGTLASKAQQEIRLKIISWQGNEKSLIIPFGSFLYKDKPGFIKKGELISEEPSNLATLGSKRLKPVYSPIEGQIGFENLKTRDLGFKNIKVCSDNGILWIYSGKSFNFPFESKTTIKEGKISKKKSFAKLKIVSPFSGFFQMENEEIKLIQKNEKIKIFLKKLSFNKINKTNVKIKVQIICKKNQFIDNFSVISYAYLFSRKNYKIYNLKTFINKQLKNIFFVSNSDIWALSLNQTYKNYNQTKLNAILKYNTKISNNLITKESGRLLKTDGLNLLFQKAYPIFLTRGSLINYSNRNFVYKNQNLASLVNYRQQTEDIVQGLPKIDDLIEARSPKKSALIAFYPSLALKLKESGYKFFNVCFSSLKLKPNFIKKVFSLKKKAIKKKGKNKNDNVQTPDYCVFNINGLILSINDKLNIIEKKIRKKDTFLQNLYKNMSFIDLAQPITDGLINSHYLLESLSLYHRKRSGSFKGSIISLNKFQLILVNSIQAIYDSQGVEISAKHIEIVVRQMTAKAEIIAAKPPFLKGEIVRLSLLIGISKILLKKKRSRKPIFQPILLSSTSSVLNKGGFLAASGFQETKRVLSKAALEGQKDWLRGLKECIISGRLIPAGSAFLNYKHYLDTLYLYKNKPSRDTLKN